MATRGFESKYISIILDREEFFLKLLEEIELATNLTLFSQ